MGYLQLQRSTLLRTHDTLISLCGHITPVKRQEIKSRTNVQTACYGTMRAQFDTMDVKVSISYAYDSTGAIYDSVLNHIDKYIAQQEAWSAKLQYPRTDFTNLPFNESFYLNDSVVIAAIRSGAENPGSSQLFYFDHHVYYVVLLERGGMGSLSSFVSQNMTLVRNDQTVIYGKYIKNTVIARAILDQERKK